MVHEGKNFDNYLKYNEIGKEDAAKKLGLGHVNTLYYHLKKEQLGRDFVRKIYKVFGYDVSENLYDSDGGRNIGLTKQREADQNVVTLRAPRNRPEGVPVYDIDLNSVTSREILAAMKPEYYVNIPQLQDCDFAGRVCDDAMCPKFCKGAIVFCRRVKNIDFIVMGRTYFIITKSDGFSVIRRLKANPNNEDSYLMIPEDVVEYEIQPIAKSEISELFIVKGQLDQ